MTSSQFNSSQILAQKSLDDFELEILTCIRTLLLAGGEPCKEFIYKFSALTGKSLTQADTYIRHRLKVSDRPANFTVFDVLPIAYITNSDALVRLFAQGTGLCVYRAPVANCHNGHIRQGVAEIINSMAVVSENLLMAIDPASDGGEDITPAEAAGCFSKIDQAIAALQKSRRTIERLVWEDKK